MFLMELPREELEVIETMGAVPSDWEAHEESHDAAADEMPWEGGGEVEFESAPTRRESRLAAAAARPLATASELHPGAEPPRLPAVSPDEFHHGMVVKHPEYGLGKVVALSGSGAKRSATVAFASSAGQRKFILSKSALRPAKSG
jgi:DNA helicase-2/ATP-dependent DNA helicase PcrA